MPSHSPSSFKLPIIQPSESKYEALTAARAPTALAALSKVPRPFLLTAPLNGFKI